MNGLRACWALGSPQWRRQMLALTVVVMCVVATVVFASTGFGYASLGTGTGGFLVSLVMAVQRVVARRRGEFAFHGEARTGPTGEV